MTAKCMPTTLPTLTENYLKQYRMNTSILKFTLTDQKSGNTIQCEARHECHSGLFLRFNGYGEASAEDGDGFPVLIEFYNNKLQVAVWNDINKQDPVIIPLDKAKESLRENK